MREIRPWSVPSQIDAGWARHGRSGEMTRGVQWALALAVLAGLGLDPAAAGQSCPVERQEDVIVDIQAAFSRGIRSTEPEYVATEEACLNACCLTKNISGDKECNLIIFDTRKIVNQQNCYLFYCPSEEACPMKPARGLVSYRRTRDLPPLDKTYLPNKNRSSEGEPVGVKSVAQAATSDPRRPPGTNSTAVSWEGEISKTSGLPNASRKQWDEIDGRAQIPPSEKTAGGLGSSQKQGIAKLLPQKGSPDSTAPAHSHPNMPTSTLAPPPPPPQTTGSTAPPMPPSPPSQTPGSALTSTSPPLQSAPEQNPTIPRSLVPSQTLPTATVPPLSTSPAGPLSLSQTPVVSSATPTPPGGRAVSETAGIGTTPSVTAADTGAQNTSLSGALATSAVHPVGPWDSGKAAFERSHPDEASVDGSNLQLDKWALLGALVAGVSFLAVGIAILGRKLFESLQRKRYSRLDYLINGIYLGI
ncbi:MANSC domain-containing protein 1 [Tachyglossus aculeatus]|uniref:MANSC domain-containing protein 1 n=1 Tax=Tachyglossus aculeatus TaxID=9261 RepID=UPI0018F2FAB0|nr:MANSC domain-containing protein 1 [Tachyglossus aculeatus]